MWKRKLCLGASESFGLPVTEQIPLIGEAGFEAFFAGWQEGAPIGEWAETARRQGMILQSIHAPFSKAADMWGSDAEKGEAALTELLQCLADCAANQVPLMVAHAFIGFEDHTPTPEGLERFSKVVREAEGLGVKVAFENTEGEEYLSALMAHFKGEPAVGFCWDSGHELCYNRAKDMLALYGDRLLSTHLNDNLGIRSREGTITWLDDLHLLPLDGIVDWDSAAARLDRWGCPDILTFELTTRSKPGRHENDGYARMPLAEYLAECYKRACRVAAKLTELS